MLHSASSLAAAAGERDCWVTGIVSADSQQADGSKEETNQERQSGCRNVRTGFHGRSRLFPAGTLQPLQAAWHSLIDQA
jgi:hypothetical protein